MKTESYHIHTDLILACQQNQSWAQEKLYKLYAPAMFQICRRILGNDDEARDLLQDSFLDAFTKLPSLRETHLFSIWLKRIVTNNCINVIRKRRLVLTELNEKIDISDEVDDFDYSKHQASAIMKAVEELPDGCRTVLNLYLFEGYDHKEIAQILAITESASKAQYCKAKGRIRSILEGRRQHVG